MQSRISIDVNEDNQPVIFIQYVDSPDVRDKLVRRFMQGFGTESNLARIEFIQHPSLESNSRMVITPISQVEISYIDGGPYENDLGTRVQISHKYTTIKEIINKLGTE